MNKFSEKDWKIFRSKIAGWQEAYMDKLNKEYIEILSGDGKPSEKFWTLEKRIKEDKKDCGVQCEMSRSNQFYIMLSLLNEGAIFMEDLEDLIEVIFVKADCFFIVDSLNWHNTDLLACLWNVLYTNVSLYFFMRILPIMGLNDCKVEY